MRDVTNQQKIVEFMHALGSRSRNAARVYLTGGSTAVLHGWRDNTVDIDLRFDPELDELYRALPELKEKLQINIELASPSDFIPPLSGWQDRCLFIGREGRLDFYHYDPYSQTLAKIERGHSQDILDVQSMLRDGLVESDKLLSLFLGIEDQLYRYPAIDPPSFARAVRQFVDQPPKK